MAELDTDSDDSDLEGVLSNVVRSIMRPPGHSGKAKRGHLCFDASYETGNLGRVDYVSEFEFDLFVRPDTSNPRFRFWFNFSVDNAQAGQMAIFNVVNFHKVKNLFSEGLTPIVRSTSRPQWTRIPKEFVYYHYSLEHKEGHHIVSFCFCFDREADVYQFALSYPYSYTRCQAFLAHIDSKKASCYRRTYIAKSVMKRNCDLITISSPKNLVPAVVETKSHISLQEPPDLPYSSPSHDAPLFQQPKQEEDIDDTVSTTETTRSVTTLSDECNKKRIVVILAREHPGDSPTSYIVQGIIELLVGNNDVADRLRDQVVFKIIPMMNPDGVFFGNHRATTMGADLNRKWACANAYAHPTLHATREMILQLNKAQWGELDLVLDLHASTSFLGTSICGNSYDDVYRHERHIVFPKMMSHACEDYFHENTIYNRDPSKAYTARRWLCSKLKDSVNCYSVKTSLLGYNDSANGSLTLYNEDAYVRVGRNIARAILDYYQFLGIIPFSLPDALPLHDLPRLRPGSPDEIVKIQPRTPKTSITRKLTELTVDETPPSAGACSSSSSSDSEKSTDDEPAASSDASGFQVKIVQHMLSSSEDSSHNPTSDDEKSVQDVPLLQMSSVASRKFLKNTRPTMRQPKANHLQLVLESHDIVNHPPLPLPTLPAKVTPVASTSAPSVQRSRKKTIIWRTPLVQPTCRLSYKYYDFNKISGIPRKRKIKKRLKRRKISRSPSSPSRSVMKKRLKKKKKKKVVKTSQTETSDDPESTFRAQELQTPKLNFVDFSKLTFGGLLDPKS